MEQTSIDWSWAFRVLLTTILAVIVILALVAAILAISAVTAGAASVVIAIGSHLLLNASALLVGVVAAVAAVLSGFALEETTYGFFVQKMNSKSDDGSSVHDYTII
jgi:O-antigen ligase